MNHVGSICRLITYFDIPEQRHTSHDQIQLILIFLGIRCRASVNGLPKDVHHLKSNAPLRWNSEFSITENPT